MFRLIFFAPYVIAEVITGVVWRLLLQPGRPGRRAARRGRPRRSLYQPWLADPDTVMLALFVIISWKYFGFHMILLLAGLQGIPRELEEAAAIDGATRRQAIRYVTLPLLGPTIRVSVFLSIIGALQLFDLVWVTTGGGPVNASNTMATYMFDWGFKRFQLGYGSAVAVILFAVALVVALAYQRFVLRRDIEGALTTEAAGDGTPTTARHAPPNATPAAGRPPDRARRRPLGASCSPSWRASIVVPIVYAVLGGFKDTGQIADDPIGLPEPVGRLELHRHPDLARRSGGSSPTASLIAAITTVLVVAVRGAGGVRLRPARVPRPRGRVHALHARPAVPGGRGDPAAVHPGPRPRAARQPARASPCPRRRSALPLTIIILRPFFRSIPTELEDAARDRRLRLVRLLLADPAAAVAAGPRDGRGARHRRQLEPVPAAAGHAVRPDQLDAAARRHELLDPVHDRHGARSSPTRPSRWSRRSSSTCRRAPARRRPDRRSGEGMTTTDPRPTAIRRLADRRARRGPRWPG